MYWEMSLLSNFEKSPTVFLGDIATIRVYVSKNLKSDYLSNKMFWQDDSHLYEIVFEVDLF